VPDSKASRFDALVRGVIYQSIAARAAEAIYYRLKERLDGKLRSAKSSHCSRQMALAALGAIPQQSENSG
jgi:3-methyladenine DNA glycosylase/8-oxoguanine DNA glycosylase